nr:MULTISPECIES: peroxiredoxin [unclassified Helicobacter]
MLRKGDKAPDFFLKNQDDIEIGLRDFGSKTIILYFYPKDNTSACTLEAQDFSNLSPLFEEMDSIIVGISPDSPKSHKGFITNKQLNIILLSDSQRQVMSAYGTYGSKIMYGKEVRGVIRSTFIIRDGIVLESFYNVRAKGHAHYILETLKKINSC